MQRQFEGGEKSSRPVKRKRWLDCISNRGRKWLFRLAVVLITALMSAVIYALISGKDIPEVVFYIVQFLVRTLLWI